MSRETKVGLVVSCSFLCLVGVVLFCKLREGGPPAQAPDTPAVASEEKLPPEPVLAKEPAPAAEGTPPGAAVVVSVPNAGKLEPTKQVEPPLQPVPSAAAPTPIQQTGAVEGEKGSPMPPSPPFLNYTGDNNSTTRPGAASANDRPSPGPELPSPAPPAPATAVPTPPPPAPPSPSVPPSVAPTTKPRTEKPVASLPPPPPSPGAAGLPKPEGSPTPSADGGGDHEFVGPPAPPAAARGKKTSAGGEKPADDKNDRTTMTVPPAPPLPTAAPLTTKEPGAAGEKTPAPPTPPAPTPALAEPTKPALPPEPAPAASPRPDSAANLGRPVPAPGATPAAEKAEPPSPQVKLGSPAAPPANQFAQAPAPPPGFAPSRPLPPVGAAPAATSPPLVAPAPRAATPAPPARVESFDEETYRCGPGDTFDSVSRVKYQSPRYAQALLLYNRDHPVAGDNFQGGVTALRPGQAIYLPPPAILEKRFGNAIRDVSTPAGSFTARGMNPSAGAAYRVRAGGEYLRAVAMRALGDSERWQEVLQLNPAVNLALPVPAGTVLRLPADARVPAENLP